ncbi:hypothetical protein [Kribbella sp. CA-294648]|uniref:hypothetical protein n=1 Tax=Kribbella sp. CA-294648 TaxID=3239948 RepID=UPI003D8AF54D
MNLDDLRAQLRDQATEIDPATPVPLPTVRRRAKTLKRRRTAAAVTTVAAAVVAVALAVLPGAVNTSTPDPAKPPPDYTRDGITIPGTVGPDRLEKAEIGKPGAGPLEFTWTPTSTSVTFRPYCRTTATKPLTVHVTVDGRLLATEDCDDSGSSPRHAGSVPPNHVFWTEVPPGKTARVRVSVADQNGRAVRSTAQLALGIYRSPVPSATPAPAEVRGLPVRPSAPDPDDYVKEGIRFPAHVGGDTLLNATIGDLGQRSVKLRFTAASARTGLRLFCTGDRTDPYRRPMLSIRIDGRPKHPATCINRLTDFYKNDGGPDPINATPGQTHEVTIDLVYAKGRPATIPGARIGVGAYALPPERLVETSAGSVGIDELARYGGYTYKLAQVKTVPAKTATELSTDAPAGKPFLIGYGAANLGSEPGEAKILGLTQEVSFRLDRGGIPADSLTRWTLSYGQPAGAGGKITLKVVSGRQTRGLLYLALYLPG